MSNFITVAEASALAKVSRGSIIYHINKSKRLKALWDPDYMCWYVSQESLEKLYPARSAGVKQKLGGDPVVVYRAKTTNVSTVDAKDYDSLIGCFSPTLANLK